MIPANLQRFIDHPFIGEAWLPLAQGLLELHKRKFQSIPLRVFSDQFVRTNGHKSPTIRVTYLSDGKVVMECSANDELFPRLRGSRFEVMEALGFAVPRKPNGSFAVLPETIDPNMNPSFYRLFDGEVEAEFLVELTMTCLELVYKAKPTDQFTCGSAQDKHLVLDELGLFDRYRASAKNPKAAIFGLKGAHNIPLHSSEDEYIE